MMPAILAKSSICYNPIIYAGLNTQFVRSLKNLFGIQDRRRAENIKTAESVTALTVVKHENKSIINDKESDEEKQGRFDA